MEARPVGLANQVWNYPRHDFVGYPTVYPTRHGLVRSFGVLLTLFSL